MEGKNEFDATIMKNLINLKISSLEKEISEMETKKQTLDYEIRNKLYEKFIFEEQLKRLEG